VNVPQETARAASLPGDAARFGVAAGNLDGRDPTTVPTGTHAASAYDDVAATERAVLGAMMVEPSCVPVVAAIVQPADYLDHRHRLIARAILSEHAERGASPILVIVDRLKAGGRLEEAGGPTYLLDLQEQAVQSTSVRRYAELVHENAARRRMADCASELEQAARGHASMAELSELYERAKPVPAGPEVRGKLPADLLQAWRDDGPLVHVPTGIVALDEMTGGGPVLGTRIYTNGAPNSGKTALAVQVADTWSQCGLVVGILGIDEEPDDLLQRFLQRRGWSRNATEVRQNGDLDRMERQVAGLPIIFYSHEDTIESAGADLARRAAAAGKPAALFVDSIQSAAAGFERTAAVAAAVASARAVASRHRMIVWCTSEMNRNAYRNTVAAAEQNGMAAGADSRSIEFQARVLLNLTSIAGSGDRIECRVVKNKLGRDHLPDEQGIVLHLNRATQELTEDTTFQVPAASKPKDAAKAKELLQDQALLAEMVARQPGLGTKELDGAFRARAACGSTRSDLARYALGGALVKLPGVRTGQLHYLDGAKVSEQVLRLVPVEFQGIVKASEPPSRTEPHSAALSRTSAPRSTLSREAHQAPIGSRCVSSRGADAGSGGEQPGECASGRSHGEAEGAA